MSHEAAPRRRAPTRLRALLLVALALPAAARAEHGGKIQILLLGDSTTAAEIPRQLAPNEPQLEDVIRLLLAAEGDLPPVEVTNLAVGGDFIRRLLDSGRYQRRVSKLPGLDYVLIRYGLNDRRREAFDTSFPADFHELVERLRADHPTALLIPTTVIPIGAPKSTDRVNARIREIAAREKLTLFDLYPRYAAELERGPDMLSYRRFPLAKIPEKLRDFARPYTRPGRIPEVVVLDNRLDAHFGRLPGWYADRHPNLAGYHVIADETAKFLAPLIRARHRKR